MAKIRIITIFAKLIINKMAEKDWFFEYITAMEPNPLMSNPNFRFKMDMRDLTSKEYIDVMHKLYDYINIELNLLRFYKNNRPPFIWVNDGGCQLNYTTCYQFFKKTLYRDIWEYPELSPYIFFY